MQRCNTDSTITLILPWVKICGAHMRAGPTLGPVTACNAVDFFASRCAPDIKLRVYDIYNAYTLNVFVFLWY